ncbi:TetR/AcrR family transcriptional regulator [uncultured Propionibacterium sp.]|uniref:TetR/AcrR family transcriptional regulator n=1 Tax=uncultured Propionibacterium sp. TaxID=218066 RepID=UPI00292EA026|nr:TetR/AcrR family transcriptional regulator [uncultured Propionibacterium sp.]
MPRVSEEYRRAQAQRILAAAHRCFARDGFHTVSMDQIIAEAGVSSSTVYRYYPQGKTQLIRSVSAVRLGPLIEHLEELVAAGPPVLPGKVFQECMALLLPPDGADEEIILDVRLAVNAWAEAARDETVCAMIRGNLATIRRLVTELARTWLTSAATPVPLSAAGIAELLMDTAFGLVAGLAIEGVDEARGALVRLTGVADGLEALFASAQGRAPAP